MKAFHDLSTNDFPRLKDGNLNHTFDDLYIPCANKAYIMHHEKNILFAVIPTMHRGNNIIKNIFEERFGDNTSSGIPYDELYKKVIDIGGITKIEDSDKEMLIYFKLEYMNTMEKYLKPKTSGKSISPFSPKNLPKGDYSIPDDDIAKYKEIVDKFDQPLKVGQITRKFCKDFDKADMKMQGLKGKEYIHMIGKWDEYLDYLKKQ